MMLLWKSSKLIGARKSPPSDVVCLSSFTESMDVPNVEFEFLEDDREGFVGGACGAWGAPRVAFVVDLVRGKTEDSISIRSSGLFLIFFFLVWHMNNLEFDAKGRDPRVELRSRVDKRLFVVPPERVSAVFFIDGVRK